MKWWFDVLGASKDYKEMIKMNRGRTSDYEKGYTSGSPDKKERKQYAMTEIWNEMVMEE